MVTTDDDQVPVTPALSLDEEDAVKTDPSTSEDETDDDEDGGDEGKEGGGGGKKPGVEVKLDDSLFLEEDLSKYDSESIIDKLKHLAFAPLSAIVSGASAFDSESDLRRQMMMGEIGLKSREIQPHDIADPNLIAKREQLNQQRQEMIRAEKLAAISATVSVAGLTAAVVMPEKVQPVQHVAPPKEPSTDIRRELEVKKEPDPTVKMSAEERQQKERLDPTKPQEEYSSQAKPIDYSADNKKTEQGLGLEMLLDMLPEKSFADNIEPVVNAGQAAKGPTLLDTVAVLFNTVAQMTQFTQPEQKTSFKLPDPAPKVDMGPMGGN